MASDVVARTVRSFYDLASKVIQESYLTDRDDEYAVPQEVLNDLASFLADFRDDNPELWNLLSDGQRRRAEESS